jgi:predicted CXXCH cytochrome family protein
VTSRLFFLAALLAAPVAIPLVLLLGHDPARHEATKPLIHREQDFVGPATCQRCHPDQHASWARTFHATMTQRAEPGAVVGGFDGQEVELHGQRARPHRDGDRFLMDVPAKGGRRSAEVVLAVGSRRYQQYFERVERSRGQVLRRLPLVWHIGARRWLHINDVFLGVDDDDWDLHTSVWDQNCVFCHNTAPMPGLRTPRGTVRKSDELTFDPHVASLGISCESCHGPGRAHVARYESPLVRYRDQLATGNDAAIVHPKKLDQAASVSLCGQCHGQRLPNPRDRVWTYLESGPSFRAGDRLTDHVTPIAPDTDFPGDDPRGFAMRFWADATPRLTAYEYQGVVGSPCYQRGPMTCLSCHVMHGGDVRGQIEPEMRGDRACLQCHQEIGRDVRAHTKHDPAGSGSRCLDCHMPRVVYGILDVHRSHKIEVPDPRRDAEAGRPNACTLCHLDRSPLWAASEMRRLWGDRYQAPQRRQDGAPLELPDSLASLYAGDAVQRVVFAKHAAWEAAPIAAADKAFLRVGLLATLLDAYPSLRWTAQQGLMALERALPTAAGDELAAWRHDGPTEARQAAAHRFLGDFAARGKGILRPPGPGFFVGSDLRPDVPAIVKLLNLQSRRAISIGE